MTTALTLTKTDFSKLYELKAELLSKFSKNKLRENVESHNFSTCNCGGSCKGSCVHGCGGCGGSSCKGSFSLL